MSRIPALGSHGQGWTALQMVTLIGILVAGGVADGTRPTEPSITETLRVVGSIGIVAGAAVAGWAVWLLRGATALSALPRPIASGSLVASGPYRLIRHPIYAGLVIGSLGIAMLRSSLLTLALAVVLFVVLDLKRRREEAWLLEHYPGYAAYRARTKALVPFLY